MNRTFSFLRKKVILLFLLVLSIASIIFIFYKNNSTKPLEENILIKKNTERATYKEIVPGEIFDEDKINILLGYPVSSTSSGEIKINKYRSSSEYRNNQIEIKDGKIDIIKEVVNPNDNKRVEDIRNIYGVSDFVLLEPDTYSFFNLYVYLANGIAYLGHKDGTVTDIWYFKPTDKESFINNWAMDYKEEATVEQNSY